MMSGLHAHSGLALDIALVLTPWGTFTSYSLPAFLAHTELGHRAHSIVDGHPLRSRSLSSHLAASLGTCQVSATLFTERTQIPRRIILALERISEVDLMSAIYPLSVHRRIERRWAERVNWLRQIHGQIVVGTERTLQGVFNNDDLLVPVPVRAIVDRRQLDQSTS
jgi:hypothetical protein